MLHITRRLAATCTIEDTAYLDTNLTMYCEICQLNLFCDIVQLQYASTITYDTHRRLHNIYLALSELKRFYKVNGKIIPLKADTLYQRFIELLPFLPPNSISWSFSLVTFL